MNHIIFLTVILPLLLVALGFVFFGIFYKPKISPIIIGANSGKNGAICAQTQIKCNTNSDCSVCVDDIEMTCQPLARYTKDQEKLYGKNAKFCLPAKPRQKCNAKNGGIYVWTGWASTNRQEFDCLCTYPDYYGGEGCEELNAGVCAGEGSFDYDARNSQTGPGKDHCTCPNGTSMVTRTYGGLPTCVPNDGKIFPNYYSGTEQGKPAGGCGPS